MTYNKTISVYEITCKSNARKYIGSSCFTELRFSKHRGKLRHNKHHCVMLQRAWNKYGEDAFVFQIVEICTLDTRLQREQHYLDSLWDTGVLYNSARRAEAGAGRHTTATRLLLSEAGKRRPPHSEATRKQLSVSNTGKKRSPESIARMTAAQQHRGPMSEAQKKLLSVANKGKKHTQEAVEKIIKAGIGRKHSATSIAKMAAAKTGKHPNEETRKKMSESQKRRPLPSAESRKKMSESQKNRLPRTPETRAKLSASHKGKIFSAETRAKMSAARRLRPPPSAETRAKLSEAGKKGKGIKKNITKTRTKQDNNND